MKSWDDMCKLNPELHQPEQPVLIAQINDGLLIPEVCDSAIRKMLYGTDPSPLSALFPPPPVEVRSRLDDLKYAVRWKYWDWKLRIQLAWECLRNRHVCDDGSYW